MPQLRSFAVKPKGPVRAFHSRPDLRPPTVTATAYTTAERAGADPGFLFLGPGPASLSGSQQYGPLIVDRLGAPVWFRPLPAGLEVTSFFCSRYRGKPVLVWWEGKIAPSGYGQGEAVLLDDAYREVARVRAAAGRSMDLHAISLTPRGTALFTCSPETVQADLSSIGGPSDGQVVESIIQEVDVESGRLEFEWRSLQHIPVDASYEPFGEPYDYLHVNSIQSLADGNLLVSGRHTWALYKLDGRTGTVIWTLGGKRSDFHMGPGAQFAWQHDGRRVSERVLTVFDNGDNGPIHTEKQARGVALEVDESRRTAMLRETYTTSQPLLPGAMGSVQVLASGQVVVGWGLASLTSQFAGDGRLLFDLALPEGLYSYRALRLPWGGTPHHQPAAAAHRDRQTGTPVVYASWNGATGVAGWQVDGGSKHDELRPLGIAKRHGFETVIPLHPQLRFASIIALDRFGRRLKRSPVIRL